MDKRALIVDDEPATCQLIEKVLGSVGMDSLSVTKSVEAPDILQHGKFAMVFLDDQMPFPDGPELTRQMLDSLRHHGASPRTLALHCGHYSLELAPFSYIAGYRMLAFLRHALS